MFKDAKKNDRVWSPLHGWGTIQYICESVLYPVRVEFDNGEDGDFDLNGHFYNDSPEPTLFWDEVKITPPPKPKKKVIKTINVKTYAWHYYSEPESTNVTFTVQSGFCPPEFTITYEAEE